MIDKVKFIQKKNQNNKKKIVAYARLVIQSKSKTKVKRADTSQYGKMKWRLESENQWSWQRNVTHMSASVRKIEQENERINGQTHLRYAT